MIETKLISISKPRRTYVDIVVKTEVIPQPPRHMVTVRKDSSGEITVIKSEKIPRRPLKVKIQQLTRVRRSAACETCGKEIKKGTPHKTAQVVMIDRKAKTSVTKHLPLHVGCGYSR